MKKRLFPIILLLFGGLIFAGNGDIHLIILHTNDVHGGIGMSTAFWMNPEFPPVLGGAASITTLIKEVRKEAEKTGAGVLIIDDGDFWQGTPVGERTKGQAVLDYFALAGYDYLVMGNHDFDKGIPFIKELVESSDIPFLCANIIDTETGEYPQWKNLKKYDIREYGEVKVGIIGAITDDMPTLQPPENLKGIAFALSALAIKKSISELREQGCDLIFVASHTGISYNLDEKYPALLDMENEALKEGLVYGTDEYIEAIYKKKGYGLQDHDIVELVPGIDVLIGGHSHSGLFPPYEDPRNHTLVIQAFSKGSALGRLDLFVNREEKVITSYRSSNYTPMLEQTPQDPDAKNMIDGYIADAESDLLEVVGVLKKPAARGNDETLLGNLISDALREEYKADFVLFNRGGMRADLAAGEVTGKDLYQAEPFGNTAVLVEIPGFELLQIIQIGFSGKRRDTQISGVKVTYNPDQHGVNKLCDVKFLDGSSIDLDKTYILVTSNYLADGAVGYGLLKKLKQTNTFTPIRDVMKNYIRRHTPIDPKLDGRIKRDKKAKISGDFQNILDELNRRLEE